MEGRGRKEIGGQNVRSRGRDGGEGVSKAGMPSSVRNKAGYIQESGNVPPLGADSPRGLVMGLYEV